MSDLSEAEQHEWTSITRRLGPGYAVLTESLARNDRPALFDQDAGKEPSWWDRNWDSPWTWRALIGVFGAICVIVPVVAR